MSLLHRHFFRLPILIYSRAYVCLSVPVRTESTGFLSSWTRVMLLRKHICVMTEQYAETSMKIWARYCEETSKLREKINWSLREEYFIIWKNIAEAKQKCVGKWIWNGGNRGYMIQCLLGDHIAYKLSTKYSGKSYIQISYIQIWAMYLG